MINDGYWKQELEKELKVFKKNKKHPFENKTAYWHRINRSLFYSAVIIRRMFEDDKEAEPYFKKHNRDMSSLALLQYKVNTIEYPIAKDEPFLLHKFIPENYSFDDQKITELKLNEICNQIIHSYTWSLAFLQDSGKVIGVLLSSDRQKKKTAYFLPLEEWIKAIEFCINKSTIRKRR